MPEDWAAVSMLLRNIDKAIAARTDHVVSAVRAA